MLLPVLPVLLVAVATFLALPSPAVAAAVVALSCAVGLAAPGTLPSHALASSQLGAVAYLLAAGARASGAADTGWSAAVLGCVATVILAVVVLHHRGGGKRGEKNL